MQTTMEDREMLDFSLGNLVAEFQIDVSYLCPGDIDEAEYELFANQYAYIKFGLILEKFRNQCWWKRCSEKFQDFREFCQQKVKLNRWQVSNAIKSANVAMRLAFLGFSELPRNASQALALADLSLEHLGEVWGTITKDIAPHKITTDVIKREISPDVQPLATTIRIPTVLLERLRKQAQDLGLSLNGYLEQLADGQLPDGGRDVETEPLTDEQIACLDRLELEWKLVPSADAESEIAIFGSAPKSGNCNASKKPDPF